MLLFKPAKVLPKPYHPLVMQGSHRNQISNSPTLGLPNVGGFKMAALNIVSLPRHIEELKMYLASDAEYILNSSMGDTKLIVFKKQYILPFSKGLPLDRVKRHTKDHKLFTNEFSEGLFTTNSSFAYINYYYFHFQIPYIFEWKTTELIALLMDGEDIKDHNLFTNEFSEYFVDVGKNTNDKRKELTAEHEYLLDKNSFLYHKRIS